MEGMRRERNKVEEEMME